MAKKLLLIQPVDPNAQPKAQAQAMLDEVMQQVKAAQGDSALHAGQASAMPPVPGAPTAAAAPPSSDAPAAPESSGT